VWIVPSPVQRVQQMRRCVASNAPSAWMSWWKGTWYRGPCARTPCTLNAPISGCPLASARARLAHAQFVIPWSWLPSSFLPRATRNSSSKSEGLASECIALSSQAYLGSFYRACLGCASAGLVSGVKYLNWKIENHPATCLQQFPTHRLDHKYTLGLCASVKVSVSACLFQRPERALSSFPNLPSFFFHFLKHCHCMPQQLTAVTGQPELS